MKISSQQKFLVWAASKDEHWPEIKKGRFTVALLDEAIQEGLAHYLKEKDIRPLREFLETALASLPQTPGEKIVPRNLAHRGLPPNQANRVKVLEELCEVYGFTGDFDSAWRTCVDGGTDCAESNYLVFARRCQEREYNAHQAYYSEAVDVPLTDAGRKHKDGIFPLVDEELKLFEAQEGKNLFDFYLDISQVIFGHCSVVADLDDFGKPKGEDLFQRGEFQNRILAEFRRRFAVGLKPFEDRLIAVFDDPEEYSKASKQAFARFKTDLIYPLRQKREFLHRHFYDVCTSGERFGLRVSSIHSLKRVYQDGQHHVSVPFFPALMRDCMGRHIARIFRSCEDRFRQTLGLRGVGQGWVSEASVFASLKKAFPDELLIHHAKPEWIGRQHLDIFFPRLNVAVEYQGVQHGRAVAIFGGEAGRAHL